jgi:tetratricopeptide (TPR) repeat protein
VVAVGWAVPESSTRDYAVLQRQLLLHAQACSKLVVKSETVWRGRDEGGSDGHVNEDEERRAVINAMNLLGNLYAAQRRLGEAEQMYERALQGYEALELGHLLALDTVNNLGNLYTVQGRLDEAEQMFKRALRGKEEAFGVDHSSTLNTVNT